jgi:hypothetical protein
VNDEILEAIRDGRHRMRSGDSSDLEAMIGSERLSTWVKEHVE